MWYQGISPNRAEKVFLRDFLAVEHVFFLHVVKIANYFANCSPTNTLLYFYCSLKEGRIAQTVEHTTFCFLSNFLIH